MTPLEDPDQDGISHLNIFSNAKTQLGRDLSHFADLPIEHPVYGQFQSCEGLWYWISRREDSLRSLCGIEAKLHGRSLPVQVTLAKDEFQKMIHLGNQAKLDTYPHIKDALASTSLRLTHYYTKIYSGQLVVTAARDSEWILAHFESIRKALNPGADMSNTRLVELQVQKEREEQAQSSMQGSLF